MHENLEHFITMKYPLLFKRLEKAKENMENGKIFEPIAFGIECGDGWFHIINNLCFSIYNYCEHNKIEFPDVVQIKEKFGTLRFYIHGGNETISQLISFAEYMTETTCEVCGNIGKTRGRGWVRTVCDIHDTSNEVSMPIFNFNVGDIVNIHTYEEILRAKIVNTEPIQVQVFKNNKEVEHDVIDVEHKINPMFSYFVFKN